MKLENLIAEMEREDAQAREREAERKAFYENKKIVSIISVTRSGVSGELILTERKILDEVIISEKRKGRIVTLPHQDELKMSCWGLCSIRCGKFNSNCRKCIKDFYGVN